MKVILLGELRGKGGEGDVIEVAQGYAENYLFPQRMALPATPGNIKQLEERRHNIVKREEKRIADAEAIKAALNNKSVFIEVKVGEEGQLFGSVTSQMIENAVKEQLNIEIDRKRIERANSIKKAGRHEVNLGLYRDIVAQLIVEVGDEEYRRGLNASEAKADSEEVAAEVEVEAADENTAE